MGLLHAGGEHGSSEWGGDHGPPPGRGGGAHGPPAGGGALAHEPPRGREGGGGGKAHGSKKAEGIAIYCICGYLTWTNNTRGGGIGLAPVSPTLSS